MFWIKEEIKMTDSDDLKNACVLLGIAFFSDLRMVIREELQRALKEHREASDDS